MKHVKLKQKGDFRINSGGLWIFSNEIRTSLKDFAPGELVEIYDNREIFKGIGYINPHSLISVRILSPKKIPIDSDFFYDRLKEALSLRQKFYRNENSFRWIFSEADYLPGIIIDLFNGIAVIQTLTYGMENLLPVITEVMRDRFDVKGIFLMNDEPVRNLEGLPSYRKYLPESAEQPENIIFEENDIRYSFSPFMAQKTGHFFDQRENRLMAAELVKNKRVLDLFTYNGSWGLNAIKAGAKSALAADSSQTALDNAVNNAKINGFEKHFRAQKVNLLKEFPFKKDYYDIIFLDPPALIKNKKNINQGIAAYIKLNRNAMTIIPPGGWLVSCSCSYHLGQKEFLEVLAKASRKAQKRIQVIEVRGQAKDHPFLPAMPETKYLKCALLRVL